MTTLNPHSDNPTFQAALSAFTFAAFHGSAFASKTMEAATQQEMDKMAADMLAAQKTLHANHKGVQFKGVRGKSVTLSYNGYILRVQVEKTKRPQAVTQTSRDAYRTVDLGERCEAVARAAIKLGVCTDNDVAREIGMPANLVSGRRNNIEDAGGITIDGVIYVVKMSGVAKRDEITKRSGNVWFLEEAFENLKPVNEPAADAVQTRLF